MSRRFGALTAGMLAAMTVPAMAHTGAGGADGFAHGFLHPLGGLDHMLAMVAVGLYATMLGGRNTWLVPVAFALTMAVGGAMGHAGVYLPLVEQGIGLSVVVMSAAIALGFRLPTALAMLLVAAFALFHGHAHGAEGADVASFAPYALGFILATSLLHVVGVALGLGLGRLAKAQTLWPRRVAGAAGVVAGALILAG
jgi:urease accessory protein